MKKITLFILFICQFSFSQVNFTEANILINKTHHSNKISAMVSADLNNDGFKEVIIGSYYDNKIVFYKNINGNIQYYQRVILTYDSSGAYHSNFNIFPKDVDQDGFVDLIVTNDFKDTTSWYKNLGDFNFSNEIIINDSLNKPTSIIAEDIDKDGDIDIIVGSDDSVNLFRNDGTNTFSSKTILFTSNRGINKLLLKDLNNDGYLDVISGDESGTINWVKNIEGNTFSDRLYLAYSSGDGFEFDFLDINNDSFLDIFIISNYDDNVSYRLNESGNSFSSNNITVGNKVDDLYNLKILDFDKDGKNDIIATTKYSGKIGWFKQNNLRGFSDFKEISNNVSFVKDFLVEDLTNDGHLEIITANSNANEKLSKFEIDSHTNSYKETIIDFFMSPAFVVKITDLDNDGKNDIISGFNSILWNKNHGNNDFSSHILISETIGNLVTDIEFLDFDQDGFLDIIAGRQDKIEFYKNNNGLNFSLEKIIPVQYFVEEIELKDINNDGVEDILIAHNYGPNPLSKIINNGNFNFQDIEPIYNPRNGIYYKDYSFKSADLDNDGDNDIVVGEKDKSRLIWLENDGSGNFVNMTIASSIACSDIDLGDIDNNGTIDIVVSGDDDYSKNDLYFFINNRSNEVETQTFKSVFVDNQSLQSIVLGDLNNDNYLDIVGTAYQPSGSGDEVFYYLFNGNQFESKIAIESLTNLGSLDKNASLGDLNNDGKLDIVSTDYQISTVKYFINSSTLSINAFSFNDNSKFIIYPNPSSEYISWNKNLTVSKLEIYNATGKKVYVNDNTRDLNKIKINFLSKGLYFIKTQLNTDDYFTKLIIE